MSERLSRVLVTRASLVVSLIDALTGKPPQGLPLRLQLSDWMKAPLKKEDGYYIFTDVPAGQYELCIQSPAYQTQTISVDVEHSEAVERVLLLQPAVTYPYAQQTAVIRGMIAKSNGKVLNDAEIQAHVLTEECASARLGTSLRANIDDEIHLQEMNGSILPGEMFRICSDKQEDEERCRIIKQQGLPRRFLLEQKVNQNHQRGDLLLPSIYSRTNDLGEFAVAFPGYRSGTFDVRLECHVAGEIYWKQEVSIQEGTTVNLGKIQVN